MVTESQLCGIWDVRKPKRHQHEILIYLICKNVGTAHT